MVKVDEYKATLRIKIRNSGTIKVKYEAELVLSRSDKFKISSSILATELEHVSLVNE